MSFETIDCVWKWPHKPPTWSSALPSPIWQLSAEDPTEDSEALSDGETTRWKGTEFLHDHVESTSWREISTLDFVWARSQLLLCQDAEMWDFVIAAGVITLPHSHRLQAFMPWSQDPPRRSLWTGCIAILLINSENAKEKVTTSFFNLLALILSALKRPTYPFILAFRRMVSGGYEQMQEWGGHWKFWKGSRVQNGHWAESCG